MRMAVIRGQERNHSGRYSHTLVIAGRLNYCARWARSTPAWGGVATRWQMRRPTGGKSRGALVLTPSDLNYVLGQDARLSREVPRYRIGAI